MSIQPSTLSANLERVRARIAAAAERSGRDAGAVELLAITKSVDAGTAAELHELGQRDLGENRADELERKCTDFRARGLEARWHYVGHLQSNKARRVAALADVIHSVDSRELLQRIDALAVELDRRPRVYLQLKLFPEERKSGVDPGELPDLLACATTLRRARLSGLMTMAPLAEPARAREVFEACARTARELERSPHARLFPEGHVRLSMGMSDDFEAAVLAGSDCVRIGSLLFAGAAD